MSDDLSDYFKYEIVRYPLSLFTNSGMRENIKSNLYEEFTYVDEAVLKKTDCFIIDGGYLLHAVKWNKNRPATYADVCNSYVQYLTDQYEYRKIVVVFDGYDSPNSIKTSEHQTDTSTPPHSFA